MTTIRMASESRAGRYKKYKSLGNLEDRTAVSNLHLLRSGPNPTLGEYFLHTVFWIVLDFVI